MPDKLRKLLETHSFFDQALNKHGKGMSPGQAHLLEVERNRSLLELLTFPSSDARVTVAQLTALLSALSVLAGGNSESEKLSKSCLKLIYRLAGQASAKGSGVEAARAAAALASGGTQRTSHGQAALSLTSHAAFLLESMTDRVAVVEPGYTYLFTNTANAAFHGVGVNELSGRPCWSIIGEECFEKLTKAKLDRCFAGHSSSIIARQPHGHTTGTYIVTYDPIRDAKGNVRSALVIGRDVYGLAAS